jgi:hypothetical protein
MKTGLCLLLLLALSSASGCSSPCGRLTRDLQRHNDALLQDPYLADSEQYKLRTIRLSADMVNYGCF